MARKVVELAHGRRGRCGLGRSGTGIARNVVDSVGNDARREATVVTADRDGARGAGVGARVEGAARRVAAIDEVGGSNAVDDLGERDHVRGDIARHERGRNRCPSDGRRRRVDRDRQCARCHALGRGVVGLARRNRPRTLGQARQDTGANARDDSTRCNRAGHVRCARLGGGNDSGGICFEPANRDRRRRLLRQIVACRLAQIGCVGKIRCRWRTRSGAINRRGSPVIGSHENRVAVEVGRCRGRKAWDQRALAARRDGQRPRCPRARDHKGAARGRAGVRKRTIDDADRGRVQRQRVGDRRGIGGGQ